ncbi:hypothetical protein P7D22_03300 [Lichenihabitans sp. Uapishka_5]|uniref:hypothetical protein n=1 Tax=Lichenihabitans sp. Uapishka_5 TaxID=3037302 RepID=UPI0029E7D93D|nr:hypothetical protein [Lichenihabitans sp. Uapishka_5]MDX7950204.1 hypothetical protein [Lichenihabitans sp. Uapishka_5]
MPSPRGGIPPAEAGPHGFRFLFRTDRGVIDRATWWRGTVPLAVIGALAELGWVLVRPFVQHGLEQPPLAVLGAYLYLLAFSFGLLVLLVCEYNLSAKRFAARGQPRALAGILPLSLLCGGAFAWVLPRSQGTIPDWTGTLAILAVAAVVVWNIVALGIRAPR